LRLDQGETLPFRTKPIEISREGGMLINSNANQNTLKFGQIENEYRQSSIANDVFNQHGVRSDITDTGVCMSMSAFYLMKNTWRRFFSWISDDSSKWEVLSQYLDENYSPLPPIYTQNRIQDLIKSELKHAGSYTVNSEDYNADIVADAISTGVVERSSARMCYFTTPDGPGHAVACLRDDDSGNIRFMDPNFGEVSFSSDLEFSNWMANIFGKHYGNFSNQTVNYYSPQSR
jgi:hypothetical protein